MSTDHSELVPPPNLPMIKLAPTPETESPAGDSENQRSYPDGGDGIVEAGCRTPTSNESRIPMSLTCPPVPRKPRASHKRRAVEKEKFEKIHRAEIEALFRSCEEVGAIVVFSAAAKRRCLCR